MSRAKPTAPTAAPPGEAIGLLLAGIALLFVGLSLSPLLPEIQQFWGVVYTLLGVLLFLTAARGLSIGRLPSLAERPLRAASGWLGLDPMRAIAVCLAPALALAAALAAGDALRMRQPALAIGLWAAGILLACLPLLPRPLRLSPLPRWEAAFIAGAFLLAFGLRAWRLAEIPWPFSSDEASAGLSAVQFIDGFRDNLFGTAWFSFPSLYFYLVSLPVRVLGRTIEALRLPSALAGAAAVVAVYAYARQAFGRGVAMAAAGYLACFHFHIHFSRIGLNNIFDSVFAALFAAALWRGWSRNSRFSFAMAGLALGLAQYFYVSSRALFPLLALWLLLAAVLKPQDLRARLPGLALLGVALLAVALPLGVFFRAHPQEFSAPFQRVTALGDRLQAEGGASPAGVLLEQVKASALAFVSTDLRLAYQPGRPMLLLIPATLFVLGVGLLLLHLGDLRHLWLMLWLLAAVATSALSLSAPAAQRYVFAAPAVVVVLALPLAQVGAWIRQFWPSNARAVPIAAALLIALAAAEDVRFYFLDYAPSRRGSDANTEIAQRLTLRLQEYDPAPQVYFFGGRVSLRSHSNLEYLLPGVLGSDVIEPLTGPPDWPLTTPSLFVFLPERESELAWVQQAYPGGQVRREQIDQMLLFVSYEVRR